MFLHITHIYLHLIMKFTFMMLPLYVDFQKNPKKPNKTQKNPIKPNKTQ